LYLLGDLNIKAICRGAKRQGPSGEYFSSYQGLLWAPRYRVPVHLSVNFDIPRQTSIVLNFEGKTVQLCPIESMRVYEKLRYRPADRENSVGLYEPELKRESSVDYELKPGFLGQAKNFLECCILKERANVDGARLSDAVRVTKFCEDLEIHEM